MTLYTEVDFYIPRGKIVIYCDGEYWHRHGTKGYNKDQRQVDVLTTEGYKVFRFTESEINKNVFNCVNEVQSYQESLKKVKK